MTPLAPSRQAGRPRAPRPAWLGLIAAIALAGCGLVSTTPPAPTPADFPGIATELASRGVRISRIVAGDPGCPDQELARTAIRFSAVGLDQPEPVDVYLYIFRNRAAFERRRADVDACARSFVSDAETFASIEASPFVLAGQGPWGESFAKELRAGLTEAAGTGG